MNKKLEIALLAHLFLSLGALNYGLFPPSIESAAQPRAIRAEPSAAIVPANFTAADFARHLEQLKKKLPSSDFTIIVQPPFVVIGDESPESVKDHSENTVKWAVDKLKQDYFTKDPKE